MYAHIKLEADDDAGFASSGFEDDMVIHNLGKINIFVGTNNSGKSRLLRYICSQKYAALAKLSEKLNLESFPERWRSKIQDTAKQYSQSGFKCTTGKSIIRLIVDSIFKEADKNVRINKSLLLNLICGCSSTEKQTEDPLHLDENTALANFDVLYGFLLNRNFFPSPPYYKFIKNCGKTPIYIPILRTLRPLLKSDQLIEALGISGGSSGESVTMPLQARIQVLFNEHENSRTSSVIDLYKAATLRDYPELKKCEGRIYTGLQIYWDIQKLLLGSVEERKSVRDFESFLSKNFFDGADVELVPNLKTPGILHVKLGNDDKDFEIHKLGDGIQAIIGILYPIFTQTSQEGTHIVCIEEPENHLHPGLQRQLIQALVQRENIQVFITTHSNHLLDSIFENSDISIYKVWQDCDTADRSRKTRFSNISVDDASILQDLGVFNTSVFLSNTTVWVEGVSDRLLFRHYLNLYCKTDEGTSFRPVEGRHFSFVEYSGSNITHWSFLNEEELPINVDKLCGKAFLIADSDNATGKKSSRLNSLKKRLADRFLELGCKELENLISPRVLSKIVTSYSDSEFDISSSWETYKDKPLGAFIDKRIRAKKHVMRRKRSFCDNKTVGAKPEFIRRAIQFTENWDDLSPRAQFVVRKIYDFIKSNNPL